MIVTSQNISQDSILVSIDDIKICNVVFNEYDRLQEEVIYYKQMNTISEVVFTTHDSIVDNLLHQISNRDLTILTKDKVHDLDMSIKDAKIKKLKRTNKFILGGSSLLLLLLLL